MTVNLSVKTLKIRKSATKHLVLLNGRYEMKVQRVDGSWDLMMMLAISENS